MIYLNLNSGDSCDKCGKKEVTPDNCMVEICQRTRGDQNVIFVHERCFERMLTKAKKETAVALTA